MENTALFLDDERLPPDDGRVWVVVRTVEQAIEYIKQNGVPAYISFDNDLQTELEGWNFAKWLVDYDLDNDGNAIPDNFEYYVHSQNVEGKKAIHAHLDRWLKYKKEELKK